MKSLTKIIQGKTGLGGKSKSKAKEEKESDDEKAENETTVLVTRFIAFEAGCTLVLQYLPQRPVRHYGPFTSRPGEVARPIPDVQWDSKILQAYRIEDLKRVILHDYKLI